MFFKTTRSTGSMILRWNTLHGPSHSRAVPEKSAFTPSLKGRKMESGMTIIVF